MPQDKEREEEGGAEAAVLLHLLQPTHNVERKGLEDAGPAVLLPSCSNWRSMLSTRRRRRRSPLCCCRRAAESGAGGSRERRRRGAQRDIAVVLLQLGHEAERGEDEGAGTAVLL